MHPQPPLTLRVLATILSLTATYPVLAVVGETQTQYQQRYGKPTHEMAVDVDHPGFIYKKKPYVIYAAFSGEVSVGEMIFKPNANLSDVDIAQLLKQNSPGWSWRKENIVQSKGDAETMQKMKILKLEMWSRIDGQSFATHVQSYTGQGKDRIPMDILLIGTQEGVDLVTQMSKMNQQWVPKPVK